MKALLYARVSTEDQTTDNQLPALREYAQRKGWEVVKEITDDGYSGRNQNRPGFRKVISMAKAKQFDVLLVFYIDRLGRNTRESLNTAHELEQLGIKIAQARFDVDTSTAGGKMVFQFQCMQAEHESNVRSERMKAWTAKRRQQGLFVGRKAHPKIDLSMVDRSKSIREVLKELASMGVRVSKSTLHRQMKETYQAV